ncbi:hypothetical protein L6164_024514 [Bauhinia variegata]|uniref:Uncharacterized protein n=1 Tax=Bauhinia variegata TaxID=167791 RepID=A0ACB9LY08_BAUVA|nr:hypothetical protein L6164_024514 [Bauhinia variegata]
MSLRRPAMNRSLNRENPDILIMMIAEKQMITGGEEDKRDQREREEMGPVKPATEMSGTIPRIYVFPSLSPSPSLSRSRSREESDTLNLDGPETRIPAFLFLGYEGNEKLLVMQKKLIYFWECLTCASGSWRPYIYSDNQLSNISKSSGLSMEVPYSGSAFCWWVITPLWIKERMN